MSIAWTGTLKNPMKWIWRWEPDRRSKFFFSLPANLCAVTYITEISLHVTLSLVELNWLFNVTINNISVIFVTDVTAHRCAGGLEKKLDLRSGSQRHRHIVGFFNVPVLYRHGTTLFIR